MVWTNTYETTEHSHTLIPANLVSYRHGKSGRNLILDYNKSNHSAPQMREYSVVVQNYINYTSPGEITDFALKLIKMT